MLNTGDGRYQHVIDAQAETQAARYARLNAAWRSRQFSTRANRFAGWDAYHLAQQGDDYTRQPHSSAWLDGWRAAEAGGPRDPGFLIRDLCPGVMAAPEHVGPDPEHIAPDLEWVCPTCRWRLAVGTDHTARHGTPAYVPLHGSHTEGASTLSPLNGQSAAWLLETTSTP